jgi:acyl-coenzyme A thioesterase PaaI-like protein
MIRTPWELRAISNPEGWRAWDPPEPEVAEAYSELVESVRRFQALLAGARPPVESSQEVTDLIDQASKILTPTQVSEFQQISGKYLGVPDRAQALVPPLRYRTVEPDFVSGTVTFSRYYLGGNWAAHGGTIPLVFDDVLGRLIGGAGRQPSRTAYLNVNFRKITPIDQELGFEGRVDRIEGRKQFLTAKITDGEFVCADAEGLFVTLKPGQP